MNPQESIEQDICNYLEGGLEPDRQSEFEAQLLDDPEALDLLCLHAQIGAGMRQPLAIPDQDAEQLMTRQNRRTFRISLAIAAAIALTTGLILHRIMVPPPESWASIDAAPGTVFSIQASGLAEQDGNLNLGETLVVSQGTAEIAMADGSRCLAEAPARITLKSPSHAHLSNGRAFFEVAKGSEGFTVTTRDLEVIDLGTAFGIDDRADHQPEVHVVEGSVRATTLSGRRESMTVTAGESVAVGAAGTLRPIPSEGFTFYQELPGALPSVHFTFDQDRDKDLEIRGSIATRESVRLLGSGARSDHPERTKGRIGGGLRFNKRSDCLETTWDGIGGSVPRTISLWVKIPEGSEGGTILGWGLSSGNRSMSDIKVTYSGDHLANLRLSSGRRWLQTVRRLDTGRWHHVAFLIDSPETDRWPTVKCYVDGESEPMKARVPEDGEAAPFETFGTITDHPNSNPLTFGNLSKNRFGSGFTGEIDEVTITAGLLDEEQIRAMAECSD